ncbi:MAG: hypothetical protein NC184_01125 [Roseburia sp.]|nr:hypothetical protein [Roseburia sp.]
MDSLQNIKKTLAAVNKNTLAFINSFIDEKSFVETDAFITSDAESVGDGVVSGFAMLDGVAVCLFATNHDVLKGSVGALNAKKITRAVNNAVRADKPIIAVWDTSGARFAEGIDCLDGYCEILRAFAVAYGEVPIISVIKGNNLGISSYVAGVSDFVIAVSGSVVASASPLVLAAKTGESEKTVGSAQKLAANGIITNIVKESELRGVISRALKAFCGDQESADDPNRVCKGLKAGVGCDVVIKEVFDKGSFLPVRADFAPVAVTGFATLCGINVGVVATDIKVSDGRLTADACVKICEFLNSCENAECPVVFLTDCSGTELTENDARLIRDMSDLIYRVNTLDVDTFAVVYGKAIGAAYTALVSPCEYKIAWDIAQVGALESESAARLLYADEIKSAKNKDKTAEKLAAAYAEENCSAVVLARKGHFDNVIEPNSTRAYLSAALLAHVE